MATVWERKEHGAKGALIGGLIGTGVRALVGGWEQKAP